MSPEWATCYLGIGSNLGDRRFYIKQALDLLASTQGIKIMQISDIIETEPVGGPTQGKFLNGAVEIQTTLTPHQLLSRLKEIERILGRQPQQEKNLPRVIDLDILLFDSLTFKTPDLEIPHPRMRQREFVLRPLGNIAPQVIKELQV